MRYRRVLIFAIASLLCLTAAAKDKKKTLLPIDVLQARTVWVIIDPEAGVDVEDPNANRIARENVENAIAKWGRLSPVTDASMADLIITVRKGNGKLAQPTIGGTPINNPPPVIMQPSDSGINAAGHTGGPQPQSSAPHPQMEVGSTEDLFVVYRGDPNHNRTSNPLDYPPVWRYSAKDALESPGVPAVDVFRKLVAESEKQANTP